MCAQSESGFALWGHQELHPQATEMKALVSVYTQGLDSRSPGYKVHRSMISQLRLVATGLGNALYEGQKCLASSSDRENNASMFAALWPCSQRLRASSDPWFSWGFDIVEAGRLIL